MPYKDKEKQKSAQRKYNANAEVRKRRNEKTKEWAIKNREYLLTKERLRRRNKRAQCLISNARTRSRRRGIGFDLDGMEMEIQQRIDAGVCEITGTPFDLSPGRKFNSPSIDRINPKFGYTPENIRIVCHAMNAAMGDWGEDPVKTMLISWLKTNPQVAAEFIRAYMADETYMDTTEGSGYGTGNA